MKPEDFLYEKDDKLYYRDALGKIKKVPKNKFSEGEIVRTKSNHCSPNRFTRIIQPNYTEERGWIYGENYINLQGMGGGSGFYTNEDNFTKLSRPEDLLFAKRIYLKENINKLNIELKSNESELEKITYALDISIPNHNKYTDDCKKCFTMFSGFDGGDPNRDLCKSCLEKERES